MKQGKVWGKTELICANSSLEFHRIDFKKGGVCSKHLHKFKWNGFYVMSGKLLIRNWRHCQDLIDETILEAGDYHAVEPGYMHQFEVLEDGVGFELYWAQFDHNDIEREYSGFNRNNPPEDRGKDV